MANQFSKEISAMSGVKSFTPETKKQNYPLCVSVNDRRLSLSETTNKKLGLKKGDKISIFHMDGEWFVARSDKGFALSQQSRGALSFTATFVVLQLKKEFGSKRLVLDPTEFHHNGAPVYKIIERISITV